MDRHVIRFAILVAMSFACTFAPLAGGAVLWNWDWNDGTTQGWAASSGVSNVGGQLQATNVGNGSLQIFGPRLAAPANIPGTTTVSFDLTITAYSTVSSPRELTLARLGFNPYAPCPPNCPQQRIAYWNLDLSDLAFDQKKTFTVSFDNVSFHNPSDPPPNMVFFDLTFAQPGFNLNNSSALLDNFRVSTPDTPTGGAAIPSLRPFLLALVAGFVVLIAMARLLRR